MDQADRHSVGQHSAQRLEPDLLLLRICGDVQISEVDGLLQFDRALRAERGYSLVLVDARDMGAMSPKIRKHAAAQMQQDPSYLGAIAIWGASYLMRTMINLLLRATALLARQAMQPVEYFTSQTEALRWLHAQRDSLQRQSQQRQAR